MATPAHPDAGGPLASEARGALPGRRLRGAGDRDRDGDLGDGSAVGLRLAVFSDTYAPQVNGVARTLERLVTAVESRGGAVRIETVDDPLHHPDARVVRWPSIPFWAYPQLRMAAPLRAQVTESLARWRPTLIHAATPFGVGLAGLAAARSMRVPFVSSYHTSFPDYLRHYRLTALNAIAWPYLRSFHNSGRRTFVPSQLVADELMRHRFDGVRVWSRGVDRSRFNPSFRSEATRAAAGAAPDDFLVAYVGRLAPEKGVHVATEAMRLLAAQGDSARRVRFMFAGDGPDEERCRATAPDGTWFAGMLHGDALAAFYASADAFVFPSLTETFGNVVLEAMASGLPVVAPDSGATLDLANEHTALTFRANDAAALAQQLARLRDDPALAAEKRAASIAVARARSWDRVWDSLVDDYRDALRTDVHTA